MRKFGYSLIAVFAMLLFVPFAATANAQVGVGIGIGPEVVDPRPMLTVLLTANGATTLITLMLVHLTAITDLTGSRAGYLSAPVPGMAMAGVTAGAGTAGVAMAAPGTATAEAVTGTVAAATVTAPADMLARAVGMPVERAVMQAGQPGAMPGEPEVTLVEHAAMPAEGRDLLAAEAEASTAEAAASTAEAAEASTVVAAADTGKF